MNTQIVLISVDHNNARKVCEQIENFVYPTLSALKETLKEKLEDINEGVMVLTISQFMDEVNDQLLDNLSEYFISYVKIG
jgi:t-SNARE complex subunit (syntaxin)